MWCVNLYRIISLEMFLDLVCNKENYEIKGKKLHICKMTF